MVLRRLNIGDKILTKKWKEPFVVVAIYKGWVAAVRDFGFGKCTYLFIRTYDQRCWYGTARFEKYGIKPDAKSLTTFINMIDYREVELDDEASTTTKILLEEEMFNVREKRFQTIRED